VGNVKELTTRPDYSGRAYVHLGENGNTQIDCSIAAPNSGRYLLRIRVMSPNTRTREITVNGTSMLVTFPASSGASWVDGVDVDVEVDLLNGSNVVSFVSGKAPNPPVDIDFIDVTPINSAISQRLDQP
jgi:hypothetical protein